MDGVVPWRERITDSIARSRKIRAATTQLATVDSIMPRCRTVGACFAPDGRLKIITDKRSAKVKESRRVEVCWWFSHRQAVRRRRRHHISDSDDNVALRKQQELSDKAREQFFWAHPAESSTRAEPPAAAATPRACWAPVMFLLGWSRPTSSTI